MTKSVYSSRFYYVAVMTPGFLFGDGISLPCLPVVCFVLFLAVTSANAGDERRRKSTDGSTFDTDAIIDSIRGAFDTVFDYLGDKDGCKYTCPNGVRPKARGTHKAKFNGCGSFGIKLDTTHLPAIERCCNAHDVCYDTCNHSKDDCDDDLRDCLTDICKAMKKYVSKDVYEGCKKMADIMYASTMALGCKPYRDSQKNACECPALPGFKTDL